MTGGEGIGFRFQRPAACAHRLLLFQVVHCRQGAETEPSQSASSTVFGLLITSSLSGPVSALSPAVFLSNVLQILTPGPSAADVYQHLPLPSPYILLILSAWADHLDGCECRWGLAA